MDEIGLRRPAAVGNGAHVDHQGAGIHLVLVLAHTGPAKLPGGDAVKIKGTSGGGQTVDGIAVRQPRFFRVLLQGIASQFLRHLGKGHVAAIGKGVADVLLPVGAGANDGLVPDLDAARAGPGAVLNIRKLFQRRRQRYSLVNGAGSKRRGQKAV